MVSFNEGIDLVRKRFPYDYVTEGFEYDNDYIFRILSHDYKNMQFQQAQLVTVNKDNGEVDMFDLGRAINDVEKYAKAKEKMIKIDEVR